MSAPVRAYAMRPNFRAVGEFEPQAAPADLLAEPGLFAADPAFVRAHGGPLTNYLLAQVPASYLAYAAESGLELNVDVRAHDLAPGDYPATPGYHCDAAQRETEFARGAATVAVRRSLVGTISSNPAGVSLTRFVSVPFELRSTQPVGGELWAELDAQVRAAHYPTVSATDGVFTEFDEWTPHEAAAAEHAGARLFIRISCWNPPPGHEPGIAKAQQVYRYV